MSPDDTWSPDEPSGTEAFEQGDEALDEQLRTDPDFLEGLELDPALDPALQLDDLELEEAGVELDDPGAFATLDGGADDPDGVDEPAPRHLRAEDDAGWDLDEPLVSLDEDEEDGDEEDGEAHEEDDE
jgi:hypothetical protein